MFHFANPEYLYLLILIPIFVIIFIINVRLKRKSLEKFGENQVIKGLMPLASKRRPMFKFILMILALALIIIAAAS